MLLIHEMGHYLAARPRGLDVGLPAFIPFVGTLAAFAAYFYGRNIGSGLWMAIAYSGFMINLFNIIPVSPLDGGRITQVLSPRIWLLGAPVLVDCFSIVPAPCC